MQAEDIIKTLGLTPHPEGGYYAETFRDLSGDDEGGRGASTAIYYLLRNGEKSHWHRVDAAEVWHFYAGAPLELSLADAGGTRTERLGPDLLSGERPQIIVPKDVWQAARSTGDWTFVGCTVAPAFDFAGFEMAPDDWSPNR
ncbi:cupin domain-containing protein [Sneathiella aquimaris]|uniref:cupin domain-containing protein n=1 Tax=Sneathiella aquimaris TaxID=2599305 RepID=UPI00146B305A|nr:cupin domain-containing protein [Sneathiella aquimaris]